METEMSPERKQFLREMEAYTKVRAAETLGACELKLSRAFCLEARRLEELQGKPESPMYVLAMGLLNAAIAMEGNRAAHA